MNNPQSLLAVLLLAAAVAGCDQLGIETPDKVAARQEAEGKAVGGACRHSGRPLEECYEMNRRSSKAAIYAGWREMDGYMRDNNIASVKPSLEEDEPASPAAPKTDAKAAPAEKKAAAAVVSKPAEETPAGAVDADKSAKVASRIS